MLPCIEMAGTDLSKLFKGPLTTHTTWKSLSLSLIVSCTLWGSGARLVLQFLSESSHLGVSEQSSASVACLDQTIWVRISVRCAFGLALASYLSSGRVGDPGALG